MLLGATFESTAMQTIQKIRENKITKNERVELVRAAKSALRRAGAYTQFIWRGEILHYGLMSAGTYIITESDNPEADCWAIETRDPFTNASSKGGFN